jgi:CHAT domain-containing protein
MRALLCVLLVAGMACAAAPPAKLTPEQEDWRRQRNTQWAEGLRAWKAGKQVEAIAALEKSLATHVRVWGRLDRTTDIIADRLGDLHHSRGEWLKAAKYRRTVFESRRALLGADHWRTVDARLDLAHALAQAKRTPQQREALDRSVALNRQAIALFRKGQPARAIPLAQRAVEIGREVLGEKHPAYAISLNNLALMCQAMGDHKQALPLCKQALQIRKEALGEKHPDYAQSLNCLAGLYDFMGDYRAALPLYKQALAIRKETQGENHLRYANTLHNLAGLYATMGDRKAALSLFLKALEIEKKVLGEKDPRYASTLNGLASLYTSMGEYKAALPLFKNALAINKEARGEKHPEYATGLHDLAHLYLFMGDHKAALPLYKQALEIYKGAYGEKHPDYALTLNSLAGLHQAMGDYKAALPLYKKALEIRKEAFGEKHPEYAFSLHKLASLYHLMGDHKAALPLSEEATIHSLAALQASAAVLSDRQQLAAAVALQSRLNLRLSLQDAGGYTHTLVWKGSALMRQRQRRLFAALSKSPKTREAAEELQLTARQIAALSASSRPAREQLQKLTERQEALQAELAKASAEARATFKAEAITPQALSKALPEGAVLVDYLFYRRQDITCRDGRPNGLWHLVAFVSRRGKPTARIDLGPSHRAVRAALTWRGLLLAGKAGRPAGAELKRLVWSPLEEHLAGAKVVLVSSAGPLAVVPFAALPGKKDGSYLIEDVALAVVPVAQLLPEMLKPVDESKRIKPSLLVVGNVDYDKTGTVARADKVGHRGAPLGIRREWVALPATFGETAAVSESFRGLFEGGRVTALRKKEATKAKVRDVLTKVRYAHLATHGFFAQESIKSALGGEQKADAFFGREGVTGWHPLLLSGVVLTGANKEPKEGQEDGILTALEVSEMQLPKLELVVLSACETGLGKSAGGEGLLGLQRAFQVAGARSVIASLWSVDDRATQALMSDFYRLAWDETSVVSKAEALRQAQLAMLRGTIADGKLRGLGKKDEKLPKGETRLPPLYWAAFVLSGDWR